MALVGTYIKKDSFVVDGEFIEVKKEYPSELPQGHPDYDKRGTFEMETQPKVDFKDTLYENSYTYIKAISVWQPNLESLGKFLVNITYQVFESKEARYNDPENFILENALFTNPIDISKDILSQCYDIIKTSMSLNNLLND